MAVNMNDIIVRVSADGDPGAGRIVGRGRFDKTVSELEGRPQLTNCRVRFEKDGCKVKIVGDAIGVASVLRSFANDSDVTLCRDDDRRRAEELTRENADLAVQVGIALAMLARDSK